MNQPFASTVGLLLVSFAQVLFVAGTAIAQASSYGGPPINYMTTEVNDPVALLSAKIESGDLKLEYDNKHGYLAAVLKALDVPVSSQTLVFSKTSLQLSRISPRRPRALYFNDDVYVGWCQRGDVLELAATDPEQGAIFYSMKQTSDGPPKVIRDRGVCLSCHSNSRTQDVPGYLMRSVYADFAGRPVYRNGTFTTDHSSPFAERWGGWYVTGNHGEMRHMGNVIFREDDSKDNERQVSGTLDREAGANVESLDEIVSTTPYLSPHSDIVALMVLQHQTQMHNAIAAASYETRRALYQSYQMNKLLERAPKHVSESAERRIKRSADRVLSYLLMCDEFALQSPVSGTSNFQKEFEAKGRRDSRGRSLRDFDLTSRLFKYPCSYLIHSPAFDALPKEVRTRVITRLRDILEGRDESPKYDHLSAETRREILEILQDTMPEFRSL